MLELHRNVLLRKCVYNFRRKLPFGAEFNQFLFLAVKYDHEYILPAENGQLNGLLDDATFPLAVGHVSLVFVSHIFNVARGLFKHYSEVSIYKLNLF